MLIVVYLKQKSKWIILKKCKNAPMGRFFVVSVDSSSDTGKIKIPVWGFVFLVACTDCIIPIQNQTNRKMLLVILLGPFHFAGATFRTVGSSSDTGKIKIPVWGFVFLVALVGLEPTLLAELDFESSASTNSATGPLRQKTN